MRNPIYYLSLMFSLALLGLSARHGYGAVFNIADGDVAGLKNAITTANTNDESDIINLAAGGTYTLTAVDNTIHGATGLPLITNDLPDPDVTIHGNGAILQRSTSAPGFRILEIVGGALVIIDGLNIANGLAIEETESGFLFTAGGGIHNNHSTLTITNSTITNCTYSTSSSQSFLGGGIFNNASNGGAARLIVSNCTFTGNSANLGGGISNFSTDFGSAQLTVSASTFTGNSAGAGGGIDNIGTHARMAVSGGAFDGNAGGYGGGIRNVRGADAVGTPTVSNCTFTDNLAFNGGGIYNNSEGAQMSLKLTDCTFSTNTAEDYGGGLFNTANYTAGAPVLVSNCTFNGNSATYGGGLLTFDVPTTLQNCTISGNTASTDAGGIYTAASDTGMAGAFVTLKNCTLSDNSSISAGALLNEGSSGTTTLTLANTLFKTGSSGANIVNTGSGVISSLGHNLSNDAAGGDGAAGPGGFLNGTGDIRNTNPQLAALASNGGPTQTHALLSTSPAINAGNNANAPPQDQRHYSRVGASDIGAFEFGGTLAPISALSRKTHGAAMFDVNLPLTGTAGIECRTGGGSGNHQVIVAFGAPVTLTGATASPGTGGTGSVAGAPSVSGNEVTVNLMNVSNAQTITITLLGVSDGTNTNDVSIQMGVLLGDTTGNGTVNASDVSQTKSKSGQAVDATNFRTDVTVSNSINSSDVSLVKSKSGTALP